MGILINKLENVKNEIITDSYGLLPVKIDVNLNNCICFDNTFEEYDIYINCDSLEVFAVHKLNEAKTEDDVNSEMQKIMDRYKGVDKVNYAESDNAIIITADEDTIEKIVDDYGDSNKYIPVKLTSTILFLEVKDGLILNEADFDLTKQLDDGTLRNIAQKAKLPLKGNESRDELRGIIKGALASSQTKM